MTNEMLLHRKSLIVMVLKVGMYTFFSSDGVLFSQTCDKSISVNFKFKEH